MAVDFSSTFASERLIYEAFDNADENIKGFLYQQMAKNPDIKALDSIQALAPLSRTSYYNETLQKWSHNLINVIVCLKPDDWEEISKDFTREEHAKGLRGVPIGMMCVAPLPPSLAHHRRAGLGMSISAQFQGKGYGSEALRWLTDWTFRQANMHTLFLQTSSLNEKAVRVYLKNGFTIDGRDRESLWINGKWYDTITMSILEREWREREEAEEKAKDA